MKARNTGENLAFLLMTILMWTLAVALIIKGL